MHLMADAARLEPVRSAPPLVRSGALDEMPPGSRYLASVSDLTNAVIWELEVPGAGVVWHAPFARLLRAQPQGGSYKVPPGPTGRLVSAEELGDAVLAPIVETVRAGIAWENYELIQEFEAPDGECHRVLVRAVSVPDRGRVRASSGSSPTSPTRTRSPGSPSTSASASSCSSSTPPTPSSSTRTA